MTKRHCSIGLSSCLLPGLHKDYWMDFNNTWKDGDWAKEEPIKFGCGSG